MQENSSLVPVVVFAFNRPDQLRHTLEALRRANIPLLYIFVDGPRHEQDLVKVTAVKQVIKAINWIVPVTKYSRRNLGLKQSIIKGLNQVFEQHDAAIVVEDDIKVSPVFYPYMTGGLAKYRGNPNIAGITALRYPFRSTHLEEDASDVFLAPRISSWGWGTWRHKWHAISFDKQYLEKKLSKQEVNLAAAGVDLPYAIHEYLEGRLESSWAVPFQINMLIANKYFVWPKKNMVENTGFTEGTHTDGNKPSWSLAWEEKPQKTTWNFPNNPQINARLLEDFLYFFETLESDAGKPSAASRIFSPFVRVKKSLRNLRQIK